MKRKTIVIWVISGGILLLGGVIGMTTLKYWGRIKAIGFIAAQDQTEQIQSGLSDGFHKWFSPKGNLYMGEWKNGNLLYGTFITKDGVYEGGLRNLRPHGYGTMYYNNGDIYSGNWANGNKEGIGKRVNAEGSSFFGNWKAGIPVEQNEKKFHFADAVYGIDISKFQHPKKIQWNNLALYCNDDGKVIAKGSGEKNYLQPVSFVFIKATQGKTKDPHFETHAQNAEKHNLTKGAYHFFTIGEDINEQIRQFVSTYKRKEGDLPPVLDVENEWTKSEAKYRKTLKKYGVKRMQQDVLTWLNVIEAYYGVKPIVYTNERWRKDFLDIPELSKYPLWLARYYNVEPEYSDWTFWQCSDLHVPMGYQSNIDINRFNGNQKDFLDFLKKR